MGWLLLLCAIAAEVAGTMALRALSTGFRLWPAVLVTVGYAVWSGVGTVGVAVLAVLIYGVKITLVGATGIALVIAGCVLLNVGSAAHG